MKRIFLVLAAAALLMIPQHALPAALALSLAEIFSLFAPEMYYIAAAQELRDDRRAGLWNFALLLSLAGAAVSGAATVLLGYGRIPAAVGAGYMLVRVVIERFRQPSGGKAKPLLCASLLCALPEALLLRGVYLIPAAALCFGLWYAAGVSTVPAYAAGLAVFALLRTDNVPSGAEVERFPARWVIGGLLTACCALSGFNGVFSAVYCAWGVIAALLCVRRGGKAWLCALLTVLQALCGGAGAYLGSVPVAAAAFIPAMLMLLLQRRALYAAWLPLRAKMIRRKNR